MLGVGLPRASTTPCIFVIIENEYICIGTYLLLIGKKAIAISSLILLDNQHLKPLPVYTLQVEARKIFPFSQSSPGK
ncbi:MAG: hypothetical protein F6K15_10325 [Okeania sp. SIO2B3]|nr:hypothetical protein [Okeania sp. SIO2B3]